MPRREEFLSNMRDALRLQDPEWDISPGTPEYKILEAVSQQLEGVSKDGLLSTYHFDVDKKVGIELDLFLSLWGFYRIKAQRSNGQVTFRRATVATSDISIPVGTQVFVPSVNGSPTIYFSTVAGAVITSGNNEITVPVEAATGGLIGNVAAYTISGFGTNLAGVTEVFNPSPIAGGTNAESDDAFRERFRRTFMRNVSGTENQFAAVAYQEGAFVNRVNAISAVERFNEQLQLIPPSDLTVDDPYIVTSETDIVSTSNTLTLTADQVAHLPNGEFYVATFSSDTIEKIHKFKKLNSFDFEVTPDIASGDHIDSLRVVFPTSAKDSKYVYPVGGELVGVNIGSNNELLAKGGETSPDYILYTLESDWSKVSESGCNLPVFYFTPSGVTRLGGPSTIVDVSYEYTPKSSRNNPPDSVNKLDIFVDGVDEQAVQEQINMPQTQYNVFDSDLGPNSVDFLREDGATHPQTDNLFTPLGRSPILSLGGEFSVQRFINTDHPGDFKYNLPNATTYYLNEDYWLVKKTSADDAVENLRGSQRSIEGIEWKTPIRLEDGSSSETYIFPRKGALENDIDLAAPFEILGNDSGNLSGYYGYVVTWEVDGRESLPSQVNTISVNNESVLVRFNDFHSRYPGVYIDEEALGKTVYRRFYRTRTTTSADAAKIGPFYLVNIVRNNSENAWWIDNKADDDLGITQPPKIPPPHAAPLDLNYNYNALIGRLDAQLEAVRLVGQDVLAHQADLIPIKFNLAVVLVPNTSALVARNSIRTALSDFLNRKQFSGDLQIADLVSVLETVPEVDNVRLLTEEEASNEVQRLEITSNQSSFASSDTLIFTVDDYSTSTLSADEQSYIIREALESLPTLNDGDTYAAPLTNTLNLAPIPETELIVQGNANAQAIHNLVDSEPANPVYLQITQFGDGNEEKDEIVKVTSSSILANTNQVFTAEISYRALNNGVVTLTTKVPHGLKVGDIVDITDVNNTFDKDDAEITAVTSKTISYEIDDEVTTVTKEQSEGKISYDVPAAYLTAEIIAKELSNNVATLTTSSVHRFQPGDEITVDIDDVLFDTNSGVVVTAITPTSVSYQVANNSTVVETEVDPVGTISTVYEVSQNIFTATVVATQVIQQSTKKLAVLTTKFMHGFQPGDIIAISDLGEDFDSDSVEILTVGSFTISYEIDGAVDTTNKIELASEDYGSVSTRIRQKNIKFIVERGQLGSAKWSYGSDVTNADSAAWIHLLGDIAVTKSREVVNNKIGVTYTITFLTNSFTGVNNWGLRSLVNIDGNSRILVTTSGDFTSSGLLVKNAGRGYGLEILANNLQTVLSRNEEDIYFVSSELPIFGGLDMVVRARNTF